MSGVPDVEPVYELAVVGAAGFLGSATMRVAREAGLAATGFDRDSPPVGEGQLVGALRDVQAVAWCASRVNPRLAEDDPDLIKEDEADLIRFLELVGNLETVPRVVLLSSGGTVYGPPSLPPFAEGAEPHPVNAYGEAKLLMETTLRQSGVPGVSLRVSNAYGPGQRPAPGQGVLAHWMTAVQSGQAVKLFGDPTSTRDYVYVDDIARAVVAAATVESVPRVVNVGSGEATTLDQLLTVLHEAVAPLEVHVERNQARSTDADHSVLDIALAREALDWVPQTPLNQGVRAMWEWLNA